MSTLEARIERYDRDWRGATLDPKAALTMAEVRGTLAAALPLACVVTDPNRPDNPIIYVNEAFEEITGYPAHEALGRNCRFLQGDAPDEAATKELRRAIDRREPVTVAIRNRRRDGSDFLNRLTISPLFSRDGSLMAFLGIQYEVTDD